MTWQDAGTVLIVGAAVAYLVRKFLLPSKPQSRPAAFISIQQVKSSSGIKSDSR
jgi:hypothetical protein